MSKPDLMAELRAQSKWLRKAAAEIAAEGHAGWGNTCLQAAEAIDTHHAEIAAAVRDARTEREIQNAARDLPEGYTVTIYVEKDSGYIDLTDSDGDPVYVNTSDKTMAEQIAEATTVAAMRAGEGSP